MITHLVVGDDCWAPTAEELQEILRKYQNAPFADGAVRGVHIGKLRGTLLGVEVEPELNLSKEQVQELVTLFQHTALAPNDGVIVTCAGIKFITEAE